MNSITAINVVNCMLCGKHTYNKKFCSTKCYHKYISVSGTISGKNNPNYNKCREKNPNSNGKYIKCSFCKKKIWRSKYKLEHNKNNFCSNSCVHKWQSDNWSGEKSPLYNKIKVNCFYCNKEFLVNRYRATHVKNICCSSKCANKMKSINSVGKNNPNFNNRWTNEQKNVASLKSKKQFKNKHGYWYNKNKPKEIVEKTRIGLKKYYKTHYNKNKGKTYIEIHGIKKAEKLIEINRNNAIKQLKSGKMYKKDTLPERIVENYLLFNNILYVKQYPYKLGVADFWLPETNTIIEVDGDYWHNYPHGKKRDKIQTEWLENNDYIVYKLWESDIKKDIMECMEWIQ